MWMQMQYFNTRVHQNNQNVAVNKQIASHTSSKAIIVID